MTNLKQANLTVKVKQLANYEVEDLNDPIFTEKLAEIQDMIGQEDGSFAGIFFHDEITSKNWKHLSIGDRMDLIKTYIQSELEYLLGNTE